MKGPKIKALQDQGNDCNWKYQKPGKEKRSQNVIYFNPLVSPYKQKQ